MELNDLEHKISFVFIGYFSSFLGPIKAKKPKFF